MHSVTFSVILLGTLIGCSSSGGPSGPLDSGAPIGDATNSGHDVTRGFDALGPVDASPVDAFSLDDAGASSTCKALQAYQVCATSDSCSAIDAKDCIAFDAVFNLAGRTAISSCFSCQAEAGTGPACVYAAALATAPGSAQTTIATHFCAACSAEAGSTCTSQFYSAGAGDGGIAGLGVALSLSFVNDSQLQAVDEMCTSQASQAGVQCADTWAECVTSALQATGAVFCTSPELPDGGSDADPGGA
jgi:hypothetical protein